MKFELKLLLLIAPILLVAFFSGSGSLSFTEAKVRADADRIRFSEVQKDRLQTKQERFVRQAIPACLESSGINPDNFALVVEIGPDGRVARSWRQDDSRFVTCFQRLMTEFFEYRGMEGSFFFSYEYQHAS